MTEWWSTLDLFQKVLYCVAIPSTLILVIQTILVLFGIGEGGEGANYSDTSGIDFDSDVSGVDFDGSMSTDGVDMSGSGDIDHNAVSHEGTSSADAASMRLFTVQTVMAFMCVFGWTTIAGYNSGSSSWRAAVVGGLFGIIAMYLIAKLAQLSTRLSDSGTFDPKNAIGIEGSVYIPIPAGGSGNGKINIVVQGRLMECDAMTEEDYGLSTGDNIRVTDIVGDVLVVEKVI